MSHNLKITKQALECLSKKWLLFDTDVLIDATNNAEDFDYLFNRLQEIDCTLVTISSVVVEFLRGAKSVQDMKKKQDYLESIVTVIPSGEMGANKGMVDLLEPQFLAAYGKSGKTVSYTDYLLAKTLKGFNRNMFLITGNHQDYPTSIFDREHIVSLSKEFKVRSYGILRFDEGKYDQKMNQLLSA